MSPEQRRVIRSLIQENRLEEARTLLLTMDDPVAEEWLPKVVEAKPEPQPGQNLFKIFYLLAIIGVLSIGIIVGKVWFRSHGTDVTSGGNTATTATAPATPVSPTTVASVVPVTASPTVDTEATQQSVATAVAQSMQTATQIVENQTVALTQSANTFMPTPVPSKECQFDAINVWSTAMNAHVHISTLIGQIQLHPNDTVIQQLKGTVAIDRASIELMPFAECLTVARKVLLDAHDEMLNGLDAYLSGQADVSNTHIDKALDDLQKYGEELQYALDHLAAP